MIGSKETASPPSHSLLQWSHLNNQMYRTCVRQETGYCMLRWMASNEENAFMISRDPGDMRASVGQDFCPNDAIIIPNASNMGVTLPCVVNVDIGGTPTPTFVQTVGK